MTFTEIAKQRLINQQLVETSFRSASELVNWFGAMQAQEYAQTKWALGLRSRHLFDKDVEQDFTEGRILRTHMLRPTWHFVTPQDIRWMLMLTAPRVHQANAFMYRKLELDNAIFNRCNDIIVSTLRDGKFLTRNTINKEFSKNNIHVEGFRLSYIMMNAELTGLICSGPRQGNQFTYALLEERVKPAALPDKDEALAELTKRYVTSRGPATIHDFSTWSGLTLADCRKGLQMMGLYLTKTTTDRLDYYAFTDMTFCKKIDSDMYLLPLFDELILGYKDRRAIMSYRNSLLPVPPFRFNNMILAEGQIIGTWERTVDRKSMAVNVDFFRHQTSRQALDQAIQHLERFTGMTVVYKDVTDRLL